ncbi:MAG: right-handed parallel beta-helix repeat-containing protein [Patescibacteria group bacterium]|nr:right-handed parallel beta-helix repeat-containing protein [Patescibacteria group bacterium]
MMRGTRIAAWLAVGWWAAWGQAGQYPVQPGDDYRAVARRLQPGDELVFLPGVHERAAMLALNGTAEQPITLRGERDPEGRRPIVQYPGEEHNLWRLEGRHIIVRDLEFHAPRSYALRVDRADHVRIENCTFRDCGAGCLSANTADVHALHVSRCYFTGSRHTPVYIGRHDGGLKVTDFRFERNMIDGRRIEAGEGYGIQLKQNVTGSVIRGNWIEQTQGPGIMVYGATEDDPALANLVERNVVVGSRNNAAILVGAGPAQVRGNLVLGNPHGGIRVYDYGNWDLLRSIDVMGNTAAGNGGYGLSFAGRLRQVRAEGNIALARPGTEGIRGPADVRAGNVIASIPPAMQTKIQTLSQSRLDPGRLVSAVDQLPQEPPDAASLAAWLDQVLSATDVR